MPPALQLLLAFGAVLLTIVPWLVWLTLRVGRLVAGRRHVLKALSEDQDLAELVASSAEALRALDDRHEQLLKSQRRHRALLARTIRYVGLVRYDAFEEIGGKLSFSAALLNEKGDGLVITSISGRQESRVYAKPVEARQSSYNLSKEEVAAIDSAFVSSETGSAGSRVKAQGDQLET